jgi:hypothetical protein
MHALLFFFFSTKNSDYIRRKRCGSVVFVDGSVVVGAHGHWLEKTSRDAN